jgi:hypothetical protein
VTERWLAFYIDVPYQAIPGKYLHDVKGSNLRLTLVSSCQIGTVLPDHEERV